MIMFFECSLFGVDVDMLIGYKVVDSRLLIGMVDVKSI